MDVQVRQGTPQPIRAGERSNQAAPTQVATVAAHDRSVESAGASRHAFLMTAAALVVGVLNYALNVVMGWRLPAEEYGRVGVSQTIILLCVWFLSAGFPWVVSRAIGRAGGAGPLESADGSEAWRTYKTAWLANLLLAAILVSALGLGFLYGWLPLSGDYSLLIVLVVITVMALGISVVPDAALQGLLRFRRLSTIRIAEAVVNTTASVALVLLGMGAVGALAGFALAAVLTSGLSIWAILDKRFWLARGWGGLSALRDALPLTLAVFGGIILTNIDLLAVKFLSGGNSDALSGAYQIAAVLARAPFFVATALVTAFYPRIARASRSGFAAAPSEQLLRWLALLVLPMHTIIVVAAPAVVSFFFPERYASSAPVLSVLGTASALLAFASGLAAILQGSNRTLGPALVMTISVIAQLAALWWLVPALGPLGAAISSSLAGLLALTWLAWQARTLGIRIRSLGRTALAVGLLAVLLLPLGLGLAGTDRPLIAIWVAGTFSAYAAVCCILGLIRASELPVLTNDQPRTGVSRSLASISIAASRLIGILNRLGENMAGGRAGRKSSL
ncbi:MAG: oligosaccharide flippase family protein [Chloroflexia bacterium]